MSVGNPSPGIPATPRAHPAPVATGGKVRWRRFAILMIPSAAVAAVLTGLTATVPVTMTNVTTDDFLVASDSLQANDLNITSG
jgi:hypothetical protein